MIDTICLRLHNLKNHGRTVAAIQAEIHGASGKVFRFSEDSKKLDDRGISEMVYFGSNNSRLLTYRRKLFIPSSAYSVNIEISLEKDYIEFLFSIPKYIWGCNIIQFVDYFDQSSQRQFAYLQEFIRMFFKRPCFVDKINYDEVEISRIDLCYNQIFPSEADKCFYFKQQCIMNEREKILDKKVSKGIDIRGLYINVPGKYNFKIYDKGLEFGKNDYRELCKKGGNPKGYDLDKLQRLANRTLRYEVTFHGGYFNYLFNQYYYSDGKSAKKGNVYRFIFKALKMDGTKGKFLRSKNFFVESMFDHYNWYQENYGERWPDCYHNDNRVTFDFNLWDGLYRMFWAYTKKFQIRNSISSSELEKRIFMIQDTIDARNMLRKKGEKERGRNLRIIKQYALLSQEQPLSEMLRLGLISRAKYFRLLKDLRKVGLDDFNPDIATIKVGLDYQEYKYYFGSFHRVGSMV